MSNLYFRYSELLKNARSVGLCHSKSERLSSHDTQMCCGLYDRRT
jgi:hypothetical protein